MTRSTAELEEALAALRDPRISLPLYGRVWDLEHGGDVRYDPAAMTYRGQQDLLQYMAEPPRNDFGMTKWLVCLKGRQVGFSTTVENAAYPLTAYTVGHDHVCLADTAFRAEYLHSRVQYLHGQWPDALRTRAEHGTRETRQLTFDRSVGGKMRTMSMQQAAAGIGQTPASIHFSEPPFCEGLGPQWSLFQPSLVNQRNVRVVFEGTAAPMSAPSSEWYRDFCNDARLGLGRLLYGFYPFWDGVKNRRPWGPGWVPDTEEIRLMEEYGAAGLSWDNLAFRREVLSSDKELRRNPALFAVFYPFDDVSCWIASGGGVIDEKLLLPLKVETEKDWGEQDEYVEYRPPREGAMYVCGVDPAGFGMKDHASFQIFEVWSDRWEQVACYAANTDPLEFVDLVEKAAKRYNMASLVIESTGVGSTPLTMLIERKYPNLYWEALGKPGKNSTNQTKPEMFGWLVDALLDRRLLIRDRDTLRQLGSYRNDKLVEGSGQSELLKGVLGRNRRPRHHWDKVSALIMAVVGARRMPNRERPRSGPVEDNVVAMPGVLTYRQQQAFRKAQQEDHERQNRPAKRTTYRSVRKKRR